MNAQEKDTAPRTHSPTRYAAIDLGTNTVKLLVADRLGGDLRTVFEDSETTRLGQGVSESRRLRPDALERTLDAVRRFVARARGFSPDKSLACATSAVRDASNRDVFLRGFRETAGFDCRVISGEEEAELIFLGATSLPALRESDLMVFDIGGGSVEFIRGRKGRVDVKASLDCGAVRMTEAFVRSDPPTAAELAAMEGSVRRILASVPDAIAKNRSDAPEEAHSDASTIRRSDEPFLLGTGGTINTLASMEMGLQRHDSARLDGYRLRLDRLRVLRDRLSGVSLERRQEWLGPNSMRADIIVAGASILVAGMEAIGCEEVTVSIRNLRHGAILRDAATGR